MKRALISIMTALAMIGGSVAVSAPAVAADGRHFDGRGHGFHKPYKRGFKRGQHRGYRKGFRQGRRDGFRSGRYYGYNHRFRHRGGHFHGRHYRRGGRGVAYGLLGFGLGVAISEAANANRNNPDVIVVPAQQPQYQPAPPAQSSVTYRNDPFPGAQCLQVREYQTTVIIGGIEREAYGPACLQQDGSWLRGAVQIAPN